ncbi:MAG TPA: CAP domain-containing protein [Ktedonobacteraceae bacterium]|nr:CAP domain-containing protein [Ktedonobacteraceae bacterium]
MGRKSWSLFGLLFVLAFALVGCGSRQNSQNTRALPTQPVLVDAVHVEQQPASTPVVIPSQKATPTPTPSPTTAPQTNPPANPPTGNSLEPYGPPPPMTAEEIQLTQMLFAQINKDRAVRGLYPFVWNDTLAAGARLHSWNMYHCGFSHTCPNGEDQCTRIANEGFAGYTDCGECIGLAGPSNPPWTNVYAVQESMINEGPGGWHYIHLTSTTLHRVGVGIYVDPSGWVWFTEDMVS